MVTSLSGHDSTIKVGFSVFDQLSYSDASLPFSNILSAQGFRDLFVEADGLFGYGEQDLWSTECHWCPVPYNFLSGI